MRSGGWNAVSGPISRNGSPGCGPPSGSPAPTRPVVVGGDLLELVGPVVDQAPAGATVVVFHAATLVYLPEPDRQQFAELMADLPAVWIWAEGPGVVSPPPQRLPAVPKPDQAWFLLGQGPRQLAGLADPHGGWLQWLNPATAGERPEAD